uniref:Uncharacterized protein n=1 Tax=Siphoviridae sp. ctvok7 TaxID=2827596 RepID=A0A8S5LLA6_9CAUD|nr:MAG TPA: hypothetical protein [Siphoviridae sp. ctvok7]
MDSAVDVWRLNTASRLQRNVENVYFLYNPIYVNIFTYMGLYRKKRF